MQKEDKDAEAKRYQEHLDSLDPKDRCQEEFKNDHAQKLTCL